MDLPSGPDVRCAKIFLRTRTGPARVILLEERPRVRAAASRRTNESWESNWRRSAMSGGRAESAEALMGRLKAGDDSVLPDLRSHFANAFCPEKWRFLRLPD